MGRPRAITRSPIAVIRRISNSTHKFVPVLTFDQKKVVPCQVKLRILAKATYNRR